MSKRVTLADVAELSGMSPTSVSLVLNDRPGSRLSQEARDRIHSAAAELGYRPNPSARSLRLGKTATVGFISDDVTVTRYASAMIRGALDVAEQHEHTVLMTEAGSDPRRVRDAVDVMMGQRPDGLVLALMGSKEIDVPPGVGNVPVVVLNGVSASGHPSVLRDEYRAGSQVAEHLLSRGHRRIAMLGDADELRWNRRLSVSIDDRLRGLEEVIAGAGAEIVDRHFTEHWEPDEGYAGMLALLDRWEDATAVIALNDRLAFGAYQAMQERGLTVGQDISVISFDDDVLASYLRPGLTTVRIPYMEMGREAMQMLLGEAPPEHRLVHMPLVERGSVANLG